MKSSVFRGNHFNIHIFTYIYTYIYIYITTPPTLVLFKPPRFAQGVAIQYIPRNMDRTGVITTIGMIWYRPIFPIFIYLNKSLLVCYIVGCQYYIQDDHYAKMTRRANIWNKLNRHQTCFQVPNVKHCDIQHITRRWYNDLKHPNNYTYIHTYIYIYCNVWNW